MSENKIVLNLEAYGYSEKAVAIWKSKGFDYMEDISAAQAESVSGIIVRLKQFIGKEVLDQYPNLEFVVSATTGWDHLDIEEMERRGIHLHSLRPHKEFLNTIPSTAEHTWALLMSLVRNVPSAHNSVKDGEWNRDAFRGHQLLNQTLGIIGLGRTGLKVSTYAEAFGMKVRYFDPYVTNEQYTKCESLEELLKCSDIVSVHIHLNEETDNLISRDILRHAKKGAFLINTSRGRVWDEAALVDGLKSGQIAGVATDVVLSEVDSAKSSALLEALRSGLVSNVIITPHLGGATWEAMWMCEEFIVEQID